jgi:hypothetical protein
MQPEQRRGQLLWRRQQPRRSRPCQRSGNERSQRLRRGCATRVHQKPESAHHMHMVMMVYSARSSICLPRCRLMQLIRRLHLSPRWRFRRQQTRQEAQQQAQQTQLCQRSPMISSQRLGNRSLQHACLRCMSRLHGAAFQMGEASPGCSAGNMSPSPVQYSTHLGFPPSVSTPAVRGTALRKSRAAAAWVYAMWQCKPFTPLAVLRTMVRPFSHQLHALQHTKLHVAKTMMSRRSRCKSC